MPKSYESLRFEPCVENMAKRVEPLLERITEDEWRIIAGWNDIVLVFSNFIGTKPEPTGFAIAYYSSPNPVITPDQIIRKLEQAVEKIEKLRFSQASTSSVSTQRKILRMFFPDDASALDKDEIFNEAEDKKVAFLEARIQELLDKVEQLQTQILDLRAKQTQREVPRDSIVKEKMIADILNKVERKIHLARYEEDKQERRYATASLLQAFEGVIPVDGWYIEWRDNLGSDTCEKIFQMVCEDQGFTLEEAKKIKEEIDSHR